MRSKGTLFVVILKKLCSYEVFQQILVLFCRFGYSIFSTFQANKNSPLHFCDTELFFIFLHSQHKKTWYSTLLSSILCWLSEMWLSNLSNVWIWIASNMVLFAMFWLQGRWTQFRASDSSGMNLIILNLSQCLYSTATIFMRSVRCITIPNRDKREYCLDCYLLNAVLLQY